MFHFSLRGENPAYVTVLFLNINKQKYIFTFKESKMLGTNIRYPTVAVINSG